MITIWKRCLLSILFVLAGGVLLFLLLYIVYRPVQAESLFPMAYAPIDTDSVFRGDPSILIDFPTRSDTSLLSLQLSATNDPNWFGYASGNGTRSNTVIDGDFVWIGTGGGVVRWNLVDKTYKMFLPSDGLVTYAVDSIVEDRNGALWFGTYAGLSMFDGRIWKTYSCSDIGFCSVWRSAIDVSGNLWFGGYLSGLSRFDGTTWQRYNSADTGVRNSSITGLAADSKGNIWTLANDSGINNLHKFDGANWITYTPSSVPNSACVSFQSIAIAPNDDLWISCGSAVAKLSNEVWTVYTSTAGVTFWPIGFGFDSSGGVWAGGDGIYKLNPSGVFSQVVVGNEASLNYNNTIGFDANGNLWTGTRHGMATYDGFATTILYTSQHLSDNNVRGFAFDFAGNLWSTVSQGGLAEFDGTRWVTHCPMDGGSSQNCKVARSVTVDHMGQVWAVGSGVSRWNGLSWLTYTHPLPLGYEFSKLAIDQNNALWLTTNDSQYLYKFDGVSSWTTYSTGLSGWSIQDIAIQGQDTVWLSSSSGVAQFNGATWTVYTTANGLPSNLVKSIAVDQSNRVWFATDNGIANFDGATWTIYTTADGLGKNDVRDVGVAPNGDIWAGMGQWGCVARFNGIGWNTYYSNYLVNGTADYLGFDVLGNVWIANNAFGVRIFNPNGLVYSRIIPITGGTVSTVNERASIEFSSNVFADTVLVTMTSQPTTDPLGLVGVGPYFEVTAVVNGTDQLAQILPGKTYTMTVHYDPSSLNGSSEGTLSLYWWDGTGWVEENSIVDIANTTITAHPNHFSLWAVLGSQYKLFLPLVVK